MSFQDSRPLDPWRWIGVPTLLCLGATIVFAMPLRIWGYQLPEPIFPLAPAFAWAVIRPSILAPVMLLGMGLFLDLLWGGPIGLWPTSILLGYATILFSRSMMTGQSRIVLWGWFAAMILISMTTAYVTTTLDVGFPPSIMAAFWQFLPTSLLYPFAHRLIDRFEDADVRFQMNFNEPSIFFHEVNERQGAFHRRAFLMGGATGLGMLALTGRLMQLQLLQANRYQNLSAANQYNFRLITPPRGRIVDRYGVELAGNRADFRLMIARDEISDPKATLERVSQLLPIEDSRKRQVMRDLANSPRFVPVSVADSLTWEEFTRINVRTPELPGVTADVGEARVYPFGGAFAHVIGYVSKISQEDLKKEGPNPEPLLLHPGFRIGKVGVEKALEHELRGKAGGQKVEVDSRGRVVRKDPRGDLPAIPGKDVVLTLDADVQNRALEMFKEESGAAVMMDCRTGDLLCLASAPSFDANAFVKGVSRAEYQQLATYDHKPLFNKALTATYPPGSTFKTMVALAALEHGVDPNRTYVCNKVWFYGGRPWHCDKAHGVQNMHGAIATSCDIFFYQTALGLGPDRIAAVARKFGPGDIFDIKISGQRAGLVPDTAYKRRAFPKDPVWHPGETPSMGIGQGYLNLNPLQICVQAARLANGRKMIKPRLIKSIGGIEQPSGAVAEDLPFAKEHIDFVRAAMASVVESGTAAATAQLGLGPIKMAGKTGTAQGHGYAGGTGTYGRRGAWASRDHAWFIAFAPYDDPRYACSVLVEHGGWGAEAAAPIAREMMRVVLLKDPEVRKRIVQPVTEAPPIDPNAPAEGRAPELPPDTPAPGNPA